MCGALDISILQLMTDVLIYIFNNCWAKETFN